MTFSAAFKIPNFRHLLILVKDAVEPAPRHTLNGAEWDTA
jgi:hypothetical protein